MADLGEKLTDKELVKLEKRIHDMYSQANKELNKTIEEYFAKFEERDKAQKALLEEGKITEQQYKNWRQAQMGRGNRFEALRDDLAERVYNANTVAAAYINDATPGVYSLNRNYAAYTIEQVHGDVGFTIYDEETVRRLLVEEPSLMPNYPQKRAVNRGIDLEYSKAQILGAVTSGLLQGKSVGKVANDLQVRVDMMERASAVRAARTAMTAAQNGGRQDSYEKAAEMGIKVRKQWVATKDARTRHSHALLDGQIVDIDKPFISDIGSKMMFPGDGRGGKPADLYNCRCTMRTAEKEGIEAEPRMMRVRNPITGENELVSEMTYQEWLAWRGDVFESAKAEADKTAADFFSLANAKELNAAVKRSTIKIQNGFACFPDGDPLNENSKKVKPLKTFYDVAMHGSPSGVGFGTEQINMSARVLASVIRHSEGYNGQKIRLLSCSTGASNGDEYCFAEELSNALGVEVKAPNDVLFISPNGVLSIGENGKGQFITFKPNQRGRRK